MRRASTRGGRTSTANELRTRLDLTCIKGRWLCRPTDPIAGMHERDFEKLFSRIVSLAPEPVGLGERWKTA